MFDRCVVTNEKDLDDANSPRFGGREEPREAVEAA
jgi:hypothetical protein